MIERANKVTTIEADGAGPNPGRWLLFKREMESGTMEDYQYKSVHDHGLPMMRMVVEGILTSQKLDAIVYPTSSRRPGLLSAPPDPPGGRDSATNIANLVGLPDLIVPAGFTGDRLPVGLSFLGAAFSEVRLLSIGFSFEQATKARRLPVHTPAQKAKRLRCRENLRVLCRMLNRARPVRGRPFQAHRLAPYRVYRVAGNVGRNMRPKS
jgi:amidase